MKHAAKRLAAKPFAAALALLATPALAQMGPPAQFFDGEYAVIGMQPDWGEPYSGTAMIVSTSETEMTITRRIGGTVISETAKLEPHSHVTEALVLNLFAADGSPAGMCLWSTDLGNYAILNCYRGDPEVHGTAGYESYFSMD